MNKRPLSIIVIACVFIASGVIGFAYHVTEFNKQRPFDIELFWVCLLRLLAIVGGVFLLRGHNWARWLVLIWIAYHVILSAFHSISEVSVHGLLLVIVAYVLFRRPATAFFRSTKQVISVEHLSPKCKRDF